MSYRHIEVHPLSGALGAEIHGVDLSDPIGDEIFSEIRRAFLDHLVIFFRDQHLTPEQHMAFGRRFGPLVAHNYLKGLNRHPEILPVVTEKDDRKVFAEGWHADVTYQQKPVLGTMLYARAVPPYGGDTLFANMYLAYESLSDGMKDLLDKLIAVHSAANVYGPGSTRDERKFKVGKSAAAQARAEHPVVRTHPETKRKSLFVNAHYTLHFKDMTEAESARLLSFLFRHTTTPDFTCRFRWQKNSIAFWDNRCSMHSPVPDYFGHRRVMHRVTIEGDRPA